MDWGYLSIYHTATYMKDTVNNNPADVVAHTHTAKPPNHMPDKRQLELTYTLVYATPKLPA
jgi:hypothetical protein